MPWRSRSATIAREHGVPIVENAPLAQALYKRVDVGERIPGDLFGPSRRCWPT